MQLTPLPLQSRSLRRAPWAALLLVAVTACATSAPTPNEAPAAPVERNGSHTHTHTPSDLAPPTRHQQIPIEVRHSRTQKDEANGEIIVEVVRAATLSIPLEVWVQSDDDAILLPQPGPVVLPDREGIDTLRFPYLLRGTPTRDARVFVSGGTPEVGYHYEQPAGFVALPPSARPTGVTVERPSIHNDGAWDQLRIVEPVALPTDLQLPKPRFTGRRTSTP
jgi:hypothetical protein